MADGSHDETEAVALAMVQARWGNGCIITAADRAKAREFIAAADALLRLRLAQQHATKLPWPRCESNGLGDRGRWPSDGTSEPALRRDTEGGLDRNEDGA